MLKDKSAKKRFGISLFALLFLAGNCTHSIAYAATEENDPILKNNYSAAHKLSFDFQNIDIRALIQLIAKNSGYNFIISDTVKGNITLNLKGVTWQQALDTILKTHALAQRQIGNVIFISTLQEITTTQAMELKSAETLANMAPLKSELVRLSYTNATDIATLLKGQGGSLLSSRGEVAVDARTNSIIIRDIEKNITDLKSTIRRLDVPTRQVLIEARIVSIDTTYEEQLGVKFGLSDSHHLSGTLTGANAIATGTNPGSVGVTDRLNFNLAAGALSTDQTAPGSIGLALARVGHLLLDLELSALEGENHAQIISRPRVITSNQQKATIETGEEIPYQESTSSGATSISFKKAVLSLEIVPQITPDNKILLKMKATQDSRGTDVKISGGATPAFIPAINTQEVESNILLKDNETIAIGGVYKTDRSNTVDRIPFLGSLPMVGNLFSHKTQHNEKHELLIFITPKILKNTMQHTETAYNSHKKPFDNNLMKDEI